jgi:hypothetical protein
VHVEASVASHTPQPGSQPSQPAFVQALVIPGTDATHKALSSVTPCLHHLFFCSTCSSNAYPVVLVQTRTPRTNTNPDRDPKTNIPRTSTPKTSIPRTSTPKTSTPRNSTPLTTRRVSPLFNTTSPLPLLPKKQPETCILHRLAPRSSPKSHMLKPEASPSTMDRPHDRTVRLLRLPPQLRAKSMHQHQTC